MAEINWGLLQTPDIVGNALKYQIAGQERGRDDAKRNALKQYATDPDGAINALMGLDPVAATALRKSRTEQAALDVQQKAGAAYASGDRAGGVKIATQGGQFDLAKQIADMGEAERKAAAERNGTLASVLFGLQDLPYEQRKARLAEIAPHAAQFNLTSEQVLGYDPTDANNQTLLAQSMSVKEHLEQADRRADNTRADAQFGETRRHNGVQEGISRSQLGVAQGNLGLRREEHTARQAQGGYGAVAALPSGFVPD